jgi:diguanylate cyclase (GGDEF)-like protein
MPTLLPLDPRTIFLVATTLILLNGAVLGVMHRSLAVDVQPAAASWRIATLLVAMGSLLLAMQPWLPEALALPLANGLILFGLTGYQVALHQFRRLRIPWWLPLPAVLGTIGIGWYTLITPRLDARIIVMSLAMMAILVACVQALLRRRGSEVMTSQRVLTALFAAVALLLALRVARTLAAPPDAVSLLQAVDLAHALPLLGIVALPVIGTTAFVLMCLERIRGQWQRAASTDYLTGLANRRTVAESGERALHAARRLEAPLAVAILDADHFKRVNDTWGHATGDRALQHLANLLETTARRSDLPGRLGGEEFVLLLEGADPAMALAAAGRFRDALRAQPLLLDGEPLALTVSIGIAVLGPDDRHFDDLLRRADAALYAAKAAGRDRVVVA